MMELVRIDSHQQLRKVPDGTNLWAAHPEHSGWGTPYTKQHGNNFWDWGNDFDVPAEDIALPVFALPVRPTRPGYRVVLD